MNAITADSIRKKSFYIGTRKGGVGKTSITVNCGHEAARYGAKVLVLDFDSQADSSVLLGADPDSDLTISDVYSLDGDTKFDDAVKSAAAVWQPRTDISFEHGGALVPGGSVSVVPADASLPNELTALSLAKPSWPTWLRRIIKDSEAAQDFDLILMDTSPSFGNSSLPAWLAAGWVLGVTGADPLSVRALEGLHDFATDVAEEDFGTPTQVLGVVINQVNSKRTIQQEQVRLACRYASEFFSDGAAGEPEAITDFPLLGRVTTPLLDERTLMARITNPREGVGAPLASTFHELANGASPSKTEEIERHRNLLNGLSSVALTALRAAQSPVLQTVAEHQSQLKGIWPPTALPDYAQGGDDDE